jgi:hypothetical protein
MRRTWVAGLAILLASALAGATAGNAVAAAAPTLVEPPRPCTLWCPAFIIEEPGTWQGDPPPVISHRWERCESATEACIAIPGATGERYDVVAADVGYWIRFVEVAENSEGFEEYVGAAELVTFLPTRNLQKPSFVGDLREGNTVRLDPGVWQAQTGEFYEVMIFRCQDSWDPSACEVVQDCVGAFCDPAGRNPWLYTLTAGDVGKRLHAIVFSDPQTTGHTETSARVLPRLVTQQPGGGGDSGSGGSGGGQSGGTPGGNTPPPSPVLVATLQARSTSAATARRRGVKLVVECNKACRYSFKLTRRGTTYASRSGESNAGRHTVTLRLTRAGKRSLRAGRYLVRGTVRDAAGTQRALKVSVVMR